MPDGLAGLVKYTGKPVSPQHTSTNGHPDQEKFYKEFDAQFKQVMPDTRIELEARIKKLPGFSTQELLLSSEKATYLQAFFAVDDVLDTLINYSRSGYIRLRLDGLLPELAFKDSMGDIEHLREAVQSGEITEDFKFLIQRQLAERIWYYWSELWEGK